MNNSENGNGRTGVISGDHCVTLPIDGGHFIFPVDLHFILANRQAPIPDDCINRHVVIRSDVADANDWSAANLNRRPCNFSLSLSLTYFTIFQKSFRAAFETVARTLQHLHHVIVIDVKNPQSLLVPNRNSLNHGPFQSIQIDYLLFLKMFKNGWGRGGGRGGSITAI